MRCYAFQRGWLLLSQPSSGIDPPPCPLPLHSKPLTDFLGSFPLDLAPYRPRSKSEDNFLSLSYPWFPNHTKLPPRNIPSATAYTAFTDNQLFPSSIRFSRLAPPHPTLLPQRLVQASLHGRHEVLLGQGFIAWLRVCRHRPKRSGNPLHIGRDPQLVGP